MSIWKLSMLFVHILFSKSWTPMKPHPWMSSMVASVSRKCHRNVTPGGRWHRAISELEPGRRISAGIGNTGRDSCDPVLDWWLYSIFCIEGFWGWVMMGAVFLSGGVFWGGIWGNMQLSFINIWVPKWGWMVSSHHRVCFGMFWILYSDARALKKQMPWKGTRMIFNKTHPLRTCLQEIEMWDCCFWFVSWYRIVILCYFAVVRVCITSVVLSLLLLFVVNTIRAVEMTWSRTAWAPYDASDGALASFMCTGVRTWS